MIHTHILTQKTYKGLEVTYLQNGTVTVKTEKGNVLSKEFKPLSDDLSQWISMFDTHVEIRNKENEVCILSLVKGFNSYFFKPSKSQYKVIYGNVIIATDIVEKIRFGFLNTESECFNNWLENTSIKNDGNVIILEGEEITHILPVKSYSKDEQYETNGCWSDAIRFPTETLKVQTEKGFTIVYNEQKQEKYFMFTQFGGFHFYSYPTVTRILAGTKLLVEDKTGTCIISLAPGFRTVNLSSTTVRNFNVVGTDLIIKDETELTHYYPLDGSTKSPSFIPHKENPKEEKLGVTLYRNDHNMVSLTHPTMAGIQFTENLYGKWFKDDEFLISQDEELTIIEVRKQACILSTHYKFTTRLFKIQNDVFYEIVDRESFSSPLICIKKGMRKVLYLLDGTFSSEWFTGEHSVIKGMIHINDREKDLYRVIVPGHTDSGYYETDDHKSPFNQKDLSLYQKGGYAKSYDKKRGFDTEWKKVVVAYWQ